MSRAPDGIRCPRGLPRKRSKRDEGLLGDVGVLPLLLFEGLVEPSSPAPSALFFGGYGFLTGEAVHRPANSSFGGTVSLSQDEVRVGSSPRGARTHRPLVVQRKRPYLHPSGEGVGQSVSDACSTHPTEASRVPRTMKVDSGSFLSRRQHNHFTLFSIPHSQVSCAVIEETYCLGGGEWSFVITNDRMLTLPLKVAHMQASLHR